MSWILFCQIEVILLSIGLVASFIVSVNQTAKDNSFFKRTAALSKAISENMMQFVKAAKENGNDE